MWLHYFKIVLSYSTGAIICIKMSDVWDFCLKDVLVFP